jgi:splicing factor U2AF subunit
MEDITSEVAKAGTVVNVTIPRPSNDQEIPGVGKVFVRYEQSEHAAVAIKMLAGRRFSDRTIIAGFYDEARFDSGDL